MATDVSAETADTFGAALRRERAREGLTQGALGALVGRRLSAVCEWESGRCGPTHKTYNKLVELFPRLKEAPRPPLRFASYDREEPVVTEEPATKQPERAAPEEAKSELEIPAQLGAQYGRALAEHALAKKMVAEARAALAAAENFEREAQKKADAAHKALLEGAMA